MKYKAAEHQRGRCSICNGLYALTAKGWIPTHYLYTAQGRSTISCSGSGTRPTRVTSPKAERVPLPATIVISGKAQLFAALQDVDVEGIKALHSAYDVAKQKGLRNVTADQFWAQNALVLATKGHYYHVEEPGERVTEQLSE